MDDGYRRLDAGSKLPLRHLSTGLRTGSASGRSGKATDYGFVDSSSATPPSVRAGRCLSRRGTTPGRVKKVSKRRSVDDFSFDMASSEEELSCPLTPVHPAWPASAPIESALHKAREDRVLDTRAFQGVTAEAYYNVHRLNGSLLFRTVELACHDESNLYELDLVLELLGNLEPDDASAASFAFYEHYGTITIHAMHLAASLGSVEVMKRLKDHYGDEVINTRSVLSKSQDGHNSVARLSPRARRLLLLDVSNSSREHYTPLLSALYMSKVEAAIWLLENNADPNLENIDGFTAIHLLARAGLPYENVWKQDEAVEALTMKLVERNADMDAETRRDVEHLPKWQCGKTALQLAASKLSSYPKHLLHLLAKSFQSPEASEPLKELTLIAKVNPHAAENLMQIVRSNRIVRKQLLLEVHQGWDDESLKNLAEVIRTAAVAAADLLDMLTFRPQVKSLQKNPLPPYAHLQNRQMVCTYQPDVCATASHQQLMLATEVSRTCSFSAIPPMPIWDYPEPDRPRIRWHSEFQTAMDLNPLESLEESKIYKVEVKVLHLPNSLDFRVSNALCGLSEQPRFMEIFGRVPVQALVEGLWQSVRAAHRLNVCIEVLVLMLVFLFGAGPLSEEADPLGSVLRSIIVAKVMFDFVNMLSTAYMLHRHAQTKWWAHLHTSSGLLTVMCCVLLALLAVPWRDAGPANLFESYGPWRVLVAANIFMRFLFLLSLLRSIRGLGETLISVQKSLPNVWSMLLVMSMVFANFACIFMTLKDRDKTTEYILIYLWLGMIFGEGDGIENISGFDTDHQTFTGEGSPVVIQASIFFMMVASFLFAVVLMNLMIAIYSNYYEQMVPLAPFHFQRTRAKESSFYLLRPAFPARCICTRSVTWCRRCSFLASALLVLLWLLLGRLADYPRCSGPVLALAMLLLQATLLLQEWHMAEEDERHYLWVCFRADLDEVYGSPGQWQRNVQSDLASLQRGVQELQRQMDHVPALQRQMDHVSAILQQLVPEELPLQTRSSLKKSSTTG